LKQKKGGGTSVPPPFFVFPAIPARRYGSPYRYTFTFR
jgi:carotenoid cleavage dioxygenase-like enzyme